MPAERACARRADRMEIPPGTAARPGDLMPPRGAPNSIPPLQLADAAGVAEVKAVLGYAERLAVVAVGRCGHADDLDVHPRAQAGLAHPVGRISASIDSARWISCMRSSQSSPRAVRAVPWVRSPWHSRSTP